MISFHTWLYRNPFVLIVHGILDQRTFNMTVHDDLLQQRETAARNLLATFSTLPCLTRLPGAGLCLQYCASLYSRSRRGRGCIQQQGVLDMAQWSSEPGSSVLVAVDAHDTVVLGFMIDVLKLIREGSYPVIWLLPHKSYWDAGHLLEDLISAMVLQALQLNPQRLVSNADPITLSDLNNASSVADWLLILQRALLGLPQIFIIIDAQLLRNTCGNDRQRTTDLMENLVSNVKTTRIKILASGTAVDVKYISRHWEASHWREITLEGGNNQGSGAGLMNLNRRHADHRRLIKSRNKRK